MVARTRLNYVIRTLPVFLYVSLTLVEIFGPGQKFLDLHSSGNQRCEGQMGEAYRAYRAGEMHARFWWGGLKEATSKTQVVLYGCETWSLTLREERKLMVFENIVLR